MRPFLIIIQLCCHASSKSIVTIFFFPFLSLSCSFLCLSAQRERECVCVRERGRERERELFPFAVLPEMKLAVHKPKTKKAN